MSCVGNVRVSRSCGEKARDGTLTLVFSARDTEHNDAVVLAEAVRRGLPFRSGAS
jgi:uncharacterized protein YeaO (DUF488 family)